jgi:glycosyltransferase involved in cell wall biosynthesis
MESKQPKITIVIPCYNYAKFLPECIESIRKQTYKNIDYFVVNDGSPDNTIEVCEKLGVKCYTKENGGLASARNYGIAKAKDGYIMCLDSDDTLPENSIELHMSIAGKMKVAQLGLIEVGDRFMVRMPEGANLNTLKRRNTVFCNSVFHKSLWKKVGGYDESTTMRWGFEDYEFWIRCAKAGASFDYLDEIGLFYRMHGNNMTSATTHPHITEIKKYIVNKHKDLYEENK